MNNLYTAVTKKDENWWIGWVLERDILTIKICKDLGFPIIPLDIFPTIDYIR